MAESKIAGPNLQQFINLANYVYTSGQDPSEFPTKIGYAPLEYNGAVVSQLDSLTGFYGEAFVSTTSSNPTVIIAFEGTNLAHSPPNKLFQAAQVDDDYDIFKGRNAPSFDSALAFTQTAVRDAEADNVAASNIYLDGHSLGAADAEYVAAKTGLPGVTFGAPGISSSNFDPQYKPDLKNYVEYGDPVGNYAANKPEALGSIVQNNSILHYGGQIYTGPNSHRNLLREILSEYKLGIAGKISAVKNFAYGFETYHPLENYAKDLKLTLYNEDGSNGSDTSFFAPLFASSVAASPLVFSSLDAVACFRSNTEIMTKRGAIAVEEVVVGDCVVTASGAHRAIRWLGHRTIDCRNHPRPRDVMPIRIAAHAFGKDRPARDLHVSPGHAICVDILGEVLIPAIALVNGATIEQVEVDEVTYWHVELDSHDIILAENLPAESYLDMGNRGFFREADVVDLAAGPDAAPSLRTHADFCRPFHADGTLVEVVRAQLAKRAEAAGWSLTDTVEMHLEVDGRLVEARMRGLKACFDVPAGARDVWLVSPTARPCDMLGLPDSRDLGVCVAALAIDDGFDMHDIAHDHPLLCVGFHAVEGGHRWTAGRAHLPAALWASCEDGFRLRVELAGMPVPRWTTPEEAISVEPRRVTIVA